ncbi:MAG: WD40/YVTN/BNR-like repeat-containing protein [Myxococcota bacterium]
MPGGEFNLAQTGNGRVFVQSGGAGPANVLDLAQLARVTNFTWSQGDITQVEVPSTSRYNDFRTVDLIRGQRGLPNLTLEGKYTLDLSERLKEVLEGCQIDLRVHFGNCRNPSDPLDGWTDGKILVLEGALPTSYDLPELGALSSDQRAEIMESIPYTGLDFYEIGTMSPGTIAGDDLENEVVAVAICDDPQCGECGEPSDGCQVMFAVEVSDGSDTARLLFSDDGFSTQGVTNVLSLAVGEDPSDMTCVGPNVVVISNDSGSLHFAPSEDIIDGSETWTEVDSGFEAGGAPNAIYSHSRTQTWIAGDGGHIYFTEDPTEDVEAQTTGGVTAENLNDIHTFDGRNVVAVGDNNAVLISDNGGETWTSVTGPATGVDLNTCWQFDRNTIFVGTSDGRLFYSTNSGSTWTEKTFPGNGAGEVRDIVFARPAVGYMAHDTADPAGRVLRTIDGGNSWYVAPEGDATLSANDRINSLAICEHDINLVMAGGLADDGVDGFMAKFAA